MTEEDAGRRAGFRDREGIVRETVSGLGVDPDLVLRLLALETQHSNLHAYGAKSRLRRAAEALIDEANAAGRDRDAEAPPR